MEYVDLTCDDESMAAVSEVIPGMESIQFTSGVCLQGHVLSAGVEQLPQRTSDVVEAGDTS